MEAAWEKASEISEEYHSYPVRRKAWFPVTIPILSSDGDGERQYIAFTIMVMEDFREEDKAKFFEDYAKAWELADSDYPIKE